MVLRNNESRDFRSRISPRIVSVAGRVVRTVHDSLSISHKNRQSGMMPTAPDIVKERWISRTDDLSKDDEASTNMSDQET